jgi:hypothetical protein
MWSPRRVAERYLRLIAGDVPADWRFDPREIEYLHGGALPEARARALIAAVVAQGGPAALQVGDKPVLERRLREFARARADTTAHACSASS